VQKVARHFDLLYRPLGTDAGHEELSVTVAEAEIGYYQGEGLLLEDAVREQVLLSVPLKVVCREECKGLCPTCGKNRNAESCGCAPPLGDPRWSALKICVKSSIVDFGRTARVKTTGNKIRDITIWLWADAARP